MPGIAPADGGRRLGWPRRRVLTIVAVFFGMFLMSVAYAFAAPLGSSPDEPEHWRYAWALATDSQPVDGWTQVPSSLAGFPGECYNEVPEETGGCAPEIVDTGRTEVDRIRFWGYPRPYYELVGIPIAVSPDTAGLLGARLVSAAIGAAFWALAFAPWLLQRRQWPMRAALALTATPLAVYFNGTINPQGFEIAAMAAVWSLSVATFLAGSRAPRWLLILWVVSVAAALFGRPLTWLWIGVALVCSLISAARSPISLVRSTRTRLASIAVLGVLSLYTAITLRDRLGAPLAGVGFIEPRDPVPLSEQLSATAWQGLDQLEKAIGLLGWLDVPLPSAVTGVWFLVAGVVMAAAFTVARRQHVLAAALCLLALCVAWAVLDPIITGQLGMPFWQGRYGAPLLMGVPILLAAATVRAAPLGLRRATSLGCVVGLATASFISITYLAVRYIWGPGWYGPRGTPRWAPYAEPVLIGGAFVVGLVAFWLAIGLVAKQTRAAATSQAEPISLPLAAAPRPTETSHPSPTRPLPASAGPQWSGLVERIRRGAIKRLR